MTLDLDVLEIESKTKNYDSIRLSAKMKPSKGFYGESAATNFLDCWIKKVSKLPEQVFGSYLTIQSAINYAVENAKDYGGDLIEVSLKYSDSDILITVEDNGQGFDVKRTLEKFNNRECYYDNAGLGLKCMDKSSAKVGFNDKGNKVFIYYVLSEGDLEKAVASAREYVALHSAIKSLLVKVKSDFNKLL